MAARPRFVDLTVIATVLVLAAVMVPTSARQDEGATKTNPVPVEQLAVATAAPDEQAPRPGDRLSNRSRHRDGRPHRGLSPELIERCLEVARDVDPALADRLEAIRREQPAQAFARALRDARYLTSLTGLKSEDPQLYDVKVKELRIDAQVDRVLEQLAEARRMSSAGVADLEAQLRGLVQQQVAVSLVARGMYLRRLNDQMKSLRDQLDHDLGHFRQAVDRRMKRLLDELDASAAPAAP
ncbi:MAG: hypothetical protein ACYS15_15950 [Planctomycetota bacterium]|jgi:hypothetical protein